jgi:hypothetical protein
MRCNDCGTESYTPSKRSDVCTACWDLRKELVHAMHHQEISPSEFQRIQQELASGRGTGAGAIRRALCLDSPQI